jgi:para-aminobenzoate synthetase/4-amino-4-deoxychorismate lyase
MRNYYVLPAISEKYIKRRDYFLLFETKLCDSHNYISYLFVDPVKVIKVKSFQGVERAFRKIEQCSKKFYLAGYFAYELGYYFEKGLFKKEDYYSSPLMHLAVFKKRFYFNHQTGETNIDLQGIFLNENPKENFSLHNLKLNITPKDYRNKILKIKDYIRKGDTYQVNFTAKYNFDFLGSALSFYSELANRQRVQYSAFCKFGPQHIISLSPELFLKRDGLKIYSQPMKGTIARGMNVGEDKENIARLKASLKNRAENLMIVDLVRNDLGRISKTGSVKVVQPFKVRKYETIFQMTSEVKGILKNDVTYFDIFKNIFPGGSVTGAPKVSTMQIIRQLEKAPRGVYCGAVGFISPDKKAVFNLPIRTISIVKNKGEMGVGGGIVYDSLPKDELSECKLKAKFLTNRYNDFKLIETLLWDKEYKFTKEHLKRLGRSAEYFDFNHNLASIYGKLKKIAKGFIRGRRYKIRLLLDREGKLESECFEISSEEGVKYAVISKHKIDPDNLFLYHKTTNRAIYDAEYSRYAAQGYFDVIFLNTKGEFTEGSISNLIIQKKNRLYTPPVSSGLLAGIYRDYLIRKRVIKEQVISKNDFIGADRVFLCNSVRGLVEVKIVYKT